MVARTSRVLNTVCPMADKELKDLISKAEKQGWRVERTKRGTTSSLRPTERTSLPLPVLPGADGV